MPKPYYDIRAQAGSDAAEIFIYDVIGGEDWNTGKVLDGKTFAADVKALGDVKELHIRVHSPGGSVFEGMAILNILDRHPARKVAYVDGIALSMASAVVHSADEIHMAENALQMIHNPYTIAMGDGEEMRKTADFLDKAKGVIAGMYARHAKMTAEQISAAMDAETWYTAEEAVAAGLATHIDKPMQIAACALPDGICKKPPPPAAAAMLQEFTHVHTEPAPIPGNSSTSASPSAVLETPVTEPGTVETHNAKGHTMSSITDALKRLVGWKPAEGEPDTEADARFEALATLIDDPAECKAAFDAGHDAKAAFAAIRAERADALAKVESLTGELTTARAETETAKAAFAKLTDEVKNAPIVIVAGEENQGTPEEQWAASAELQATFKTAKAYAAYRKRFDQEG